VKAATAYGYNDAGRLGGITAPGLAGFGYEYLANSPLVENIQFSNTTARVMTTTKSYDYLNRLRYIASVNTTPAILSSNAYAYNTASQRTKATNELGKRWDYEYDSLGQVTKGWQHDANGDALSDRKYEYLFDDIGNRDSTTINTVTTEYTANLLNQYSAVGGANPVCDLDGNEESDGTWTRVWDGENRLITAYKTGKHLKFGYDYMGRRVQKRVWNNTDGTGTAALDQRFIYDGWNLITTLDGLASLATVQTFTWGLDLSGSLQGAGGVGGLLAVTVPSGGNAGTYFPCYDGNGNVMALVNTSGTVSASYEYGPFGELLTTPSGLALANPFRFSTKYQDDETGLLYYGYRYYVPSTGRWLSRDPIGERGEVNLYGFLGNDGLDKADYLGLWKIYDALKDKPTGTYGLGITLGGFLKSLLPEDLKGAADYAVKFYTEAVSPIDFEYHLGKMAFTFGGKKPDFKCVFFSFWIRGDLPTISRKLKAGVEWEGSASGQISITDCCTYKYEDVSFSGRIYLNGKLGLAVGIAPANVGINARTATSLWVSRFATDKEQDLRLNVEVNIAGGIHGQLGNGETTVAPIDFTRSKSFPIPIPQ
jgi:RHS repeat-associated protein